MSEFIIIQVGQCGNQIGSVLLPQILQDYGISLTKNGSSGNEVASNLQEYLSCFINLGSKHKVYRTLDDLVKCKAKARIICVDMEDSVVGRFQCGQFKDLYSKKCLITNYPGSGNNWAEGYHTHGQHYKNKILEAIRFHVERCDNLHGFILIFSAGGGTGSGLGSHIVKLLSENYPNIERFVIIIYATGTEDVITCPYNTALSTQKIGEYATCVFPVENRTLLEIVNKQKSRYSGECKPTQCFKPFEDMNQVVVDMILHLTSGARFPGDLNLDMNEINTNMVPFAKLNFLSSGFSPLTFKTVDSKHTGKRIKSDNFIASCSRNNQLLKLDPLDPRHITFGTTLLARGKYTINDLRGYVDKLQKRIHFAPWSKKTIKVALCSVPPKTSDYSMFSLFNTTAMTNVHENILEKFTKLFERKAHIHHYTIVNGFEYEDFENCQIWLNDITNLYTEMQNNST